MRYQKITNEQRNQARCVDLPAYVDYYFPDRLIKTGKSYRDHLYMDISIWYSEEQGKWFFKCYGESQNENAVINGRPINGEDAIAYVRRFCDIESYAEAVISLCEFDDMTKNELGLDPDANPDESSPFT